LIEKALPAATEHEFIVSKPFFGAEKGFFLDWTLRNHSSASGEGLLSGRVTSSRESITLTSRITTQHQVQPQQDSAEIPKKANPTLGPFRRIYLIKGKFLLPFFCLLEKQLIDKVCSSHSLLDDESNRLEEIRKHKRQ
jgi:hypothetical protein